MQKEGDARMCKVTDLAALVRASNTETQSTALTNSRQYVISRIEKLRAKRYFAKISPESHCDLVRDVDYISRARSPEINSMLQYL